MHIHKLKCPKGTGDIYGNLLRQIAIRGYQTWRLAGFCVGNKGNMLGFSGNCYFDSIALWSGKLEIKKEPFDTSFCSETFTEVKNSKGMYESNNFIITNLPEGMISFDAFLIKASGSRSVEENAEAIREANSELEKYVAVSSRHSDVVSIAFRVEQLSNADIVIFTRDSDKIEKALHLLKDTVNSFELEEGESTY